MFRLDPQPEVIDWEEADNIGLRWSVLPEGCSIPQHAHTYDHVTMIAFGVVDLQEEAGEKVRHVGPCAIVIKAHKKHLFTVVERAMIVCIHNISRTGVIEVAEEHQLEGL